MKQFKLSEINDLTPEEQEHIAKIIDLEKQYQEILWDLFTSDEFVENLLAIEEDIQDKYDELSKKWDLKNKLKIPAERLTRFFVYNKLSEINLGIYPSVISSDIAFITNDAVINIDIKTLDVKGNSGDIKNLQFLSNQSSIINKNFGKHPKIKNSGIVVETALPTTYTSNLTNNMTLPVLTYFLTIVYVDDKRTFKINRNNNFGTIHLTNLPNGFVCVLYDYDLLDNFKTYNYFPDKDYSTVLLEGATDYNTANEIIEEMYKDKEGFLTYKFKEKTVVLNLMEEHPEYGTNLMQVPVRRGNNVSNYKYYLETIKKGDTYRISEDKLKERFDSNDLYWDGVKVFTLKKR